MDLINFSDGATAALVTASDVAERVGLTGTYEVECYGPDGALRWRERIDNLVVTVGKNYILESGLQAAALTTVGPFMGLISSVGYTAIDPTDTMASHAGWTEAGATNAPTYTAPRKTALFSAAAAGVKALSSALSFAITSSGTIKGVFITTGTGATSAIGATGGTLLSAALLAGGDKVVGSGDTVNVSWSLAA
jgi:hypothetical protein